MGKIERVLQDIFPGRDSGEFTEAERELALRAIGAAARDAKRSRIPRRDVRIGETFLSKGKEYRCVRVPKSVDFRDACSGCAFERSACPAARCSKFDRADGNFVWFVEEPKA